jgi:hypothetical protein
MALVEASGVIVLDRCRCLAAANVRLESLADIPTSPRHVRFTPNNGRWAAHPRRHLEELCHQTVTSARFVAIKRPHHTSVVPPRLAEGVAA